MNSELYGNVYNIPDNILNEISINLQKFKKINTNGKRRATHLLRNKTVTYQELKRLKNYFDNLSTNFDVIEFGLNGGQLMKNFVNNLLDSERRKVEKGKYNKSVYGGLENQYIKPHEKNLRVNTENNFLTTESVNNEIVFKNICLGFIFDENQNILLLKRSKDDDWCPNLFALPGGNKEENETPENAVIREIKEECGLDVKKHIFKKTILKDNIIEQLYLIKTTDLNIKLNEEHSDYKFFSIEEIKINKELCVPHVLEYIKLVIN